MSHELRTPMHAILSFSDFGLKKLEKASLAYFWRLPSKKYNQDTNIQQELFANNTGYVVKRLTDSTCKLNLRGLYYKHKNKI